jgi:SAM-dependent methyltransferase
LNEICKTHNIVDLNLKAGSVIFFNDLLIHSSGMNKSLIDRPSIVMGVRKNIKPLNNDILDLEIKKRKQFIIDFLKQKISDLEKGISNVGVKGENLNETWNEIYERIPWIVEQDYKNKTEFTIEDLLKIDGHSISKTGKFNIEKWYNFIDEIKFNIDYDENKMSSILEIGCGCGALLKSFEKNQVYGIDLSKKMVDIAKLALPNGNFFDDHANKINLNSNTMDYILSHSCFQYFNNNQYFEETISEISRLLKSNGKIAITDVFNESNKKLNIDYRIKQIGKEKYDKLYKNLPHFYIDKNYFVSVLKKNNFDNIKIIDAGYDDEENKDVSFRYNIYAIKV